MKVGRQLVQHPPIKKERGDHHGDLKGLMREGVKDRRPPQSEELNIHTEDHVAEYGPNNSENG
jgi:hypothetical protein